MLTLPDSEELETLVRDILLLLIHLQCGEKNSTDPAKVSVMLTLPDRDLKNIDLVFLFWAKRTKILCLIQSDT